LKAPSCFWKISYAPGGVVDGQAVVAKFSTPRRSASSLTSGLALSIDELEDDHPHRRFVLAMAMYAGHQLRSDCPYDDPTAERWARAL
jgi:hypothetical protein